MDAGLIVTSTSTFSELSEVLRREKFDRYVTAKEREKFLVRFLEEARLVAVTQNFAACRDPKDDKFLELAVCSGAHTLVSSDQDLLALHPFRGVNIVTPARF